MNNPDSTYGQEEVRDLDLSREFESFAAKIRNCLFKNNSVQAAELNLFLQSSTILISYGVKLYRRISEDFVKKNGAPMLHGMSPDEMSLTLYSNLLKAGFRLKEDQSNFGDIVALASIFDVLVKFRREN